MAKILVAEDSLTDLQYIKEMLTGTGHEVITAMDGDEAEEKARSEAVDLIVLDVVMPKKNGFQVCRSLKKDEKFKHIPIIMTTSKTQESDRFWGLKQGADEYITKPFEPIDLLLAIKKHLMRV
ncbi:alkaline phosphatase synthesis transcriptional regulatory protein PhoP [bacterium BMS3Bbin06]|nr:alkaline phosphatase synthesis transcriptional regulatory protein PhoP [bacterium BMS3Abin08]GBE34046.1 alkaline phosphatase synthesis transcriptional regulatory protein PhoP [bacterium BMS3Bbin06]HDO36505.1 response regulator [Nitrospirota bacterium]HDY72419.1 response regulator [Nitrospirota bacterium]